MMDKDLEWGQALARFTGPEMIKYMASYGWELRGGYYECIQCSKPSRDTSLIGNAMDQKPGILPHPEGWEVLGPSEVGGVPIPPYAWCTLCMLPEWSVDDWPRGGPEGAARN